MKNIIKIFALVATLFVGFYSCSDDDDLVFTAVAPEEGVSFTNTFLSEYILTQQTAGNLAERFTWSDAHFDVPTPVTYELQKSFSGMFDEEDISVGTTGGNELGVTVGQMLGYAAEAGLDNDPETEEPNMGEIFFRVRAFVGQDSSTEAFTPTIPINIVLPEVVEGGGGGGIEVSEWGVVGSAYNDWGGAGPDGAFYTTSEAGVIVSYVTLIDGQIKFRTNNDWSSGDDLGDSEPDGVLDQNPDNNIDVTAGNYRITINTNDNTYTIEEWSWGVVGSGYNDWGSAGPDAKFYYDYTTDTFKVGVQLIDGQIKFRTNNDWSSGDDLGDAGADGVLDQDPDNNINVTAGHYLITIDFNTNEYSIEATDVWGVVGSGYNDWGSAGPDFALTEIQENILYGDVATLIDGQIKFRTNNDWSSGDDLGDAGADGFLDQDPDNNIDVTAGLYRVRVDLNDNSYQLNKIQ